VRRFDPSTVDAEGYRSARVLDAELLGECSDKATCVTFGSSNAGGHVRHGRFVYKCLE